MSRLEKYQDNYRHARLERRDGILQVTFHTGGGPLIWAEGPHTEFGDLFTDISRAVEMTERRGEMINTSSPMPPGAGAPT